MLIVSFIRHAESLDNLKSVWAGHRDAELSELGEWPCDVRTVDPTECQQATALGASYADAPLDAIITSDLKRAHATAIALCNGQPNPKPSFTAARDLREQNFGDAEGHPWLVRQIPNKSLEDHFRVGQYPTLCERDDKFPNGESLNDLAARAERAIDDLVLKPYLSPAVLSGAGGVHVAVVSHGLCIGELIPALLKRNYGGAPSRDYGGLVNTAWTRVTVQAKPGAEITNGLDTLPALIVTVTDVNRHEHINNVKRQKGIVAHDHKQRGIREFFGGGGIKSVEGGIEERNLSVDSGMDAGHPASDAGDQEAF